MSTYYSFSDGREFAEATSNCTTHSTPVFLKVKYFFLRSWTRDCGKTPHCASVLFATIFICFRIASSRFAERCQLRPTLRNCTMPS